MSIRDWPDDERPREKLLQRGAPALSDAELLAIFLRTGLPGRSAVDLARDMLKQHSGLRTLLALDQGSFCATPGLGPAKYVQLQAVMELARRYLAETLERGDAIQSAADTRRYLTARMRHHAHEVFAALFLDNKHRVIQFEELFFGTIDSASVHPRQVVKRALYHNAAAAIVAHNHPSGIAEPSRADELLTVRLKEALALVDVRLLDHVVIGDSQTISLAERGLL
ncbi:MAG: DNA repair protein RadC [Candidatus Competibacter sp.]